MKDRRPIPLNSFDVAAELADLVVELDELVTEMGITDGRGRLARLTGRNRALAERLIGSMMVVAAPESIGGGR